MNLTRKIAGLLLLGSAVTLQGAHTEARLLFAAESVKPGDTVLAGVHLKMEEGWHTYWRNSGEAGAPTTIDWVLPQGFTAGEIQWPVPEKFLAAGLTTYGYHHEVLLIVPIKISGSAADSVRISAKVNWLECKEECLMGKATIDAPLTVGPQTKPSAQAAIFANWQKRLPTEGTEGGARASWENAVGDTRTLTIQTSLPGVTDFFPYIIENLEIAGPTERAAGAATGTVLRKQVKKLEGEWPPRMKGLLISGAGAEARGQEINVAVEDSASPGGTGTAVGPPQSETGLLGMLGLAFLGGLILNIMPCVLPVIALKILGFVQQSREAPGRVRRLGLVYGLGVIFSFLVLAGLVIGVQQAGRAANWGMQFQNPQFVVVMTTLVALVAMNLFGVFEVNLGGRVMDAASSASNQEGATGAFFNGILATALATPCTAPFLAIALGFAFAQPPGTIVLMFLVMALGLAAPYMLLSWFPQWLRFVPKPGVWMERFKVAMGFPMLATAVWLLTLTVPHYGVRGPLWVGLFLVFLAFAAWVWGQFVQTGARRSTFAAVVALLLLGIGYVYPLEWELRWRTPTTVEAGRHFARPDGIPWQPWSSAAVEQARVAGRPVLVDFTADWCVTCQANKKSSLEIPSVREKLKSVNAVALLGDYTREDPAITAELRRFGRAGVPLVIVYPRAAEKSPIVLPTLLTPGTVLSALDEAAK